MKLTSPNLSNCKFCRKTKNGYIWDQKYPPLLFLGKKFKKPFSYLKSAPTYFLHSKNSRKKKKCLNLRSVIASWAFRNKIALFRYFPASIKKTYCEIENQHPQICRIPKFWAKKRKTWDQICHGTKKKPIVIFEISTLKLLKFQKFSEKQKRINLGLKMSYWAFLTDNAFFRYFWGKT